MSETIEAAMKSQVKIELKIADFVSFVMARILFMNLSLSEWLLSHPLKAHARDCWRYKYFKQEQAQGG